MSKVKTVVLSCEPYRESILAVCCRPQDALAEIQKVEHFSNYENPFNLCDGRFITSSEGHSFLWINSEKRKDEKICILAHELVHVISCLFDTRGVIYDLNNDELAAYMMQYLMEQALTKKLI